MRSELDAVLRDVRIDRRRFLAAAGVFGATALLGSCRAGQSRQGAASPPASRPPVEEEPGELRIIEWAGYDVKPLYRAYLRRFPDDEPRFTYITNTESVIGKVRAGFRADLVHPETSYARDFVALGTMQPFDTDLLPHLGDLNPDLVSVGVLDGQQYHIPTDWGFSTVLYNADHVDADEQTYALLFDERYPGKITWFDTPWVLIMAGLVLGVEDIYDMTDDELDEVKRFCIDRKHLVRNLWTNPTDLDQDFAQGNVWIAYAWNASYLAALNNGVNAVYCTRPKEGVITWTEGFMLFADTENYYHAHAYVDAWARPETAYWLIENYGYGHTNTSIDLSRLSPEVVEAFRLDDPEAFKPPAHIDRWIPRRTAYNAAWDEVKAA